MRVLILGLSLSPNPLHACAVCFGKGDNAGLLSGLNWGLLILLGSTFLLIAGIAAAVWKIEKHRAQRERALFGKAVHP